MGILLSRKTSWDLLLFLEISRWRASPLLATIVTSDPEEVDWIWTYDQPLDIGSNILLYGNFGKLGIELHFKIYLWMLWMLVLRSLVPIKNGIKNILWRSFDRLFFHLWKSKGPIGFFDGAEQGSSYGDDMAVWLDLNYGLKSWMGVGKGTNKRA